LDAESASSLTQSDLDAGLINASCVDKDNDGFGQGCFRGKDCDDDDPTVTDECYRCVHPETEGCACKRGIDPVVCYLDNTKNEEGRTVCNEGTRFCREGKWTGCESVRSYVASESSSAKLINPDAGVVNCAQCYVNCYKVNDPLTPVDGGLTDANCDFGNIVYADGGGLGLARTDDASTSGPFFAYDGGTTCTLDAAIDQDHDCIPDDLDPNPTVKPFDTTNPTIFLQLGPGQSGSGDLSIQFHIKTTDVYFLLDQTLTMAEEKTNLMNDLTSGNFIKAGDTCIDANGVNITATLKTQGVIGAIRCYMRGAKFGAGFFREIPFGSYGGNDEIPFRNYQDITDNYTAVKTALSRMTNVGNLDFPEGHTQALWSLATGMDSTAGNGALYMGYDRPGVPPRTDCPTETWGYPCFRTGAIPVVVMFTDGQMHNSIDDGLGCLFGCDYDSPLTTTTGTTSAYNPVANVNETFTTAMNLGDVTTSYVTYTGDTWPMTADIAATTVGCNSTAAAHDAVFKFTVTGTNIPITISTDGSDYDTVISLHNSAYANLECDDDDGSVASGSKISNKKLTGPGPFYVVVKGKGATPHGPYHLTIGNGTTVTGNTVAKGAFVPKTWDQTVGALQSKGIKVMTVLSSNGLLGFLFGDTARLQAKALATATGAVGKGGVATEPLVYDIQSNGDGLSSTLIDGIKQLTQNISMKVSARVIFSPDANPGFTTSPFIETLHTAGDLCDAPVGIVYQNCRPDALPKFRVTFTNPVGAPVPPSSDPKGGYNFRVEMIGRTSDMPASAPWYVLDSVPVYIIPAPPQANYAPSASYWQDIQGKGCTGNDRPDWTDLTWNAALPDGTSITFAACAANAQAGLASCSYQTVATVRAAGACTTNAQCTNGGTCAANHVCQTITAASCTSASTCASTATCTNSACTYAAQPADVGLALGMTNTLPYLRLRATLYSDSAHHQTPTLYDWKATYVCSSEL
jgi:hypothetical protein